MKVFFQKFTDECKLGLKLINTDPLKIAAEDNNDAPFYLEDSFFEIKELIEILRDKWSCQCPEHGYNNVPHVEN